MSSPDANAAETAVRQYLEFLANPASLRDDELIANLDKEARSTTTDPIRRLRLFAERDRAKAVNGEPFKLGFVLHAKAWAAEQDIPISAFKAMKVPDEVLEAAGLAPAGKGRGAGKGPKMTAARVKAHILALSGDFRMSEIQAAIGGNTTTIKRAIDQLVEAGDVTRVGPLENHPGNGRAPIVYRR